MTNTFKGNRLVHIPVTITPEDRDYRYNGKQCSWWTEEPYIKYDAVLMSAYHAIGRFEPKDGVSARERFGVRDDVLMFGDSGGFQIFQASNGSLQAPNIREILNPLKVLRWQESCCDIGMTLDIPLPRAGILPSMSAKGYTQDLYEERLKESAANAIQMAENREVSSKKFKLFNCIHGNSLEDMMRWYDVTTDHGRVEYDGFSLATSVEIKYLLALRLGFAMEHSVGKPFHLLGISSPQALALIAYANKNYLKTQIYYDSSSASIGRTKRKYMLSWDMMSNGIILSEDHKRYESMQTLGCPCPVCSQLEKSSDLWAEKTISGILITLHNLYWMTQYTEFINNLVYCDDEFQAYAKRITHEPDDFGKTCDANGNVKPDKDGKSWVMKYMYFLDLVHDEGLETAWNKVFEGGTDSITEWL